jgi:hypothetical protein
LSRFRQRTHIPGSRRIAYRARLNVTVTLVAALTLPPASVPSKVLGPLATLNDSCAAAIEMGSKRLLPAGSGKERKLLSSDRKLAAQCFELLRLRKRFCDA